MKNTTLCYIEQDGRYLMLHRNKKERDENKDKWIGVGGKFLENESPEDCLLREVWEETGLHIALEEGFRQSVEYYPRPNIRKQVVYFWAMRTMTVPGAKRRRSARSAGLR